jgi:2-polyprenyl-3-methyl-5-hydroxy-6-metoxy-1,4-benzoquinol methylase
MCGGACDVLEATGTAGMNAAPMAERGSRTPPPPPFKGAELDAPRFTAHNIRLDDGTLTKPEAGETIDRHPWFLAAKRILDVTCQGPRNKMRLLDLGCLEGGYSVEFARLGYRTVGLDVRDANIATCRYVESRIKVEALKFVQDDAWNVAQYGEFDATFCCGLLYHLDKPLEFLRLLSKITRRILILQTHFAEAKDPPAWIHPRRLRRAIARILPLRHTATTTHRLSHLVGNEGVPGRWFSEFRNERAYRDRANRRWASWNNRESFWIQREYLIQAIRDVGFDAVLEQYDGLGSDIAEEMTVGSYRMSGRSMFIGLKTSFLDEALSGPKITPPPGVRRR